ncbi:MAG TPA: ATP-binding protein [Steroidobacteraceae bacterium]|nr:ATP-binding protein [Steroidobacteraceae bacterium]
MSARPDFTRTPPGDSLDFLSHDSDCGRIARAVAWSSTALGEPAHWSPALRMMMQFVLANRFPQMLWWGPEYICSYNDAYAPVLGAKHPWAMGKPVREVWGEIWDVLRPLIDTPFNGGPSTWVEDIELDLNRHGFAEECHFTIAYSPVPDETAPRGIGGVLATIVEITDKVISERRVQILRDLGIQVAESNSDVDACTVAIDILARHTHDVPFAMLYLLDRDGRQLRLVSRTGIEAEGAGPAEIDLGAEPDGLRWPLVSALRNERTELLGGVRGLPPVTVGSSTHTPDTIAVVPIKSSIAHQPAGALVVGLSPRIRLDERYAGFLELMGAQIATAIAKTRAYEEERRRAAALAEIDRAKTAFFSNVSHEFRTPLTLMLGPLGDLRADPTLPAPAHAALDVAHRNSLRLLKLVNSLLDFARIEAGRTTACFEPLELGTLTADLASNFRSAMERAGLRFDVDCAPLDEPVHVDRDMWEKIVLNLLSNAFKFTHAGRIAVQLRRDGTHALLEVADTGIGIAADELPRMFERFYRIEGAQGRTHEGSGIGLALVQELIKLHGGAIEARSEPGRGTIFRVRIPFGTAHLPREQLRARGGGGGTTIGAQAFVQEALRWLPDGADGRGDGVTPLAEATPAAEDPRFAATRGARILLADDNADMRGYVRDLLGAMYQIVPVTNGLEALEAARREVPDLVISDVMMPRLDGLGLLKSLRRDPALREVPVILLSARAGEEARIEGMDAGADDYVIKPFTARELLARVGALLELTRVRRAGEERRRQELEQASRQKDEFLAMLAHELRNPLAPIRNAGELLSRKLPADAPMRTAVHTIERQVTHLTRLVDDLLDVSRITQGRIELRRSATLVADIVARSLETADPLIRRKHHKVSINATSWNLHVEVDPERMVQCLSNVLTNAAKYTEPGGEIHVDIRDAPGVVVIRVSDNGVGIAPELLPRVFDMFVQGERTLDRSQGGLGIGLSVVKRLVEMHDGEVTIHSDGERRGTRVELRLPLLRAGSGGQQRVAVAASPARRILVVDDNEDAANTLAMILKLDGHVVDTAFSGHEALERARDFEPQVMLLDIGLPGLDGFGVAQRIRAQPRFRELQLVAITGYGQNADRLRTQEAGFAGHLVKPVDFAELKRMLAALPVNTCNANT